LRSLGAENLQKMGVVMKRARYFILCNGRRADRRCPGLRELRHILATSRSITGRYPQLELFPDEREILTVL